MMSERERVAPRCRREVIEVIEARHKSENPALAPSRVNHRLARASEAPLGDDFSEELTSSRT